jgi:hypothetical protein
MMKYLFVFGLSLLIFSGCAPQKKYYWGGYENDLYNFYKSPQTPEDQASYMAQLSTLMENAQESKGLVPPGIYAEYGYALFKTGKYPEANVYFEKEKSAWPESKPLMERLIANVHVLMNKKTPLSEK